MTPFGHIFQTVRLRHKILKNRVVFGAHTTNMAVDGLPGDQHIAYYVERAMGGAAMIVVEPIPVHPAAVLTRAISAPGQMPLSRISAALPKPATPMARS